MPTFSLVEAKPWHCGMMARLQRAKHTISMIGLDPKEAHREIRQSFDASLIRRSWFIDGQLALIGGVIGSAVGAYGVVWLALADTATRYPLALTKMIRSQLDQIMVVKRLLICNVLVDDPAAERLAIFLGFVPYDEHNNYILPAVSRAGRREIARLMADDEEIRMPIGSSYAKIMAYRQIEAG